MILKTSPIIPSVESKIHSSYTSEIYFTITEILIMLHYEIPYKRTIFMQDFLARLFQAIKTV